MIILVSSYAWTMRHGAIFEIQLKDDMFGYVAASPDKSYLIAVGLR